MTRNPVNSDRDKHITMMRSSFRWPLWPRLPLVRRHEGKPDDLGVLIEPRFNHGKYLVKIGNLCDSRLWEAEHVEFANADAVYDAGWRVD